MGKDTSSRPDGAQWHFLSNHGHVLICLARDPTVRLRDIAQRVGITERAAHKIVADLENAGVITKFRQGRRNHYQVHREQPLRHVIESHCNIGSLLDMVGIHAETAAYAYSATQSTDDVAPPPPPDFESERAMYRNTSGKPLLGDDETATVGRDFTLYRRK